MLKTSVGRSGANAPDLLDQLQPAHTGERNVRDHQIPLAAIDLFERALRIGCLADDGVLDAFGEHRANTLARDGMVVHEQNANHRGCCLTFRARCPPWATGFAAAPAPARRPQSRRRVVRRY